MDRFVIKTVHGDQMDLIINHFGHILINIDNYDESDDPDFKDDTETHAGICLDKDRAIKLRDKLTEMIEVMFPGSGHEHMLLQLEEKKRKEEEMLKL